MKVLLCGDLSDAEVTIWLRELARAWPQGQWLTLDEAHAHPDAVRAAVVAKPPLGALQGLPRLELIQSLWAGVDSLLADHSLPTGVPIARMVDPAMNEAMAETVLWSALSFQRHHFTFASQQQAKSWQSWPQRRADQFRIGVLGLGEMGLTAARRLAANGYHVSGWARSARNLPEGVHGCFGRPALHAMASQCELLINLLPLTEDTHGVLDSALFSAMPEGAGLVNLARGAHLVEADLLAALDSGQIGHAVLDVFATEPLPVMHAFWPHPRVTVLPHAAAATGARSAARVVAANLTALAAGRPIAHRVDRERGY